MGRAHADYLREKAIKCCTLAAECEMEVSTKLLAIALDLDIMAVALEVEETRARLRGRDDHDDRQAQGDELVRAVARYLDPTARLMPHLFTVLYVEDDSAVRHPVSMMLAEKGFAVLSAPDADAALRVLEERPVDLLFTDIVMPGMNGVELARRARILHPAIKVLFVTGFPGRAEESGAKDHGKLLYKPLRQDELLHEIETALAA